MRRVAITSGEFVTRDTMSKRKKPTELEACVLGLVWVQGPCTAYTVRRVFQRSPSPHWSGSAGAIYPLVNRLTRQGLLRGEPHATGKRRSKRLVLTPAGQRALLAWLRPPLPDWVFGVPPDPLRTRLRFLGALPAAEQTKFLADAERQIEFYLQASEAECERQRDDVYAYRMSRGAVAALRARLDWVREIAEDLQSGKTSARKNNS